MYVQAYQAATTVSVRGPNHYSGAVGVWEFLSASLFVSLHYDIAGVTDLCRVNQRIVPVNVHFKG